MIEELEWVKSQRPQTESPTAEGRRRARAALEAAIADARPRRRSVPALLRPANLAAAAALVVVLAVVGVFLGTHTRGTTAPAVQGGPELVFQATPTARARGVSRDAVGQAASLIQALIAGSPGEHGQVSVSSAGERLIVHLSRQSAASRLNLLSLMAVTGRLAFFDWEANALMPTGRSVVSRLRALDPGALTISQGVGSTAPGGPGAGALSLYRAVRLSADQAESSSGENSRPAAEYFAFAGPGSSACTTAARYYGVRPSASGNCYLAGPAATANQVLSLLPGGTSPSEAQVLAVPRGIVVLQAVPTAGFARGPTVADPRARFYVLRDRVGIFGTSTTNATIGTDASRAPVVTVSFTPRGQAAFGELTAGVAHRGDLVSGLGQVLNQHFAIALGNQLVAVPSIDFRTYPDGVPGNSGADIVGGFTRRSSQTALLEVRLGSLPIMLRMLSAR